MADGSLLQLRVSCGGMRWRLQGHDRIEVWRNTTLVGTLSEHALTVLIEQHLLSAEMLGWLQAAPRAPSGNGAAPAPSPPTPSRRPLAKAPQKDMLPFTPQERSAKQAQRRARKRAVRKLIVLGAVIFTASCAKAVWTGGAPGALVRDLYECDRETWRPTAAPYASPAAPASGAGASQALFNLSDALFARAAHERRFETCMALRGYTRTERTP